MASALIAKLFPDPAGKTLSATAPHRLHIEGASRGLCLIMQSGVTLACTTGISLTELLQEEFLLSKEQLKGLDVFMLDGKPVDAPQSALVPDGSRLALAAGLPGIAGLAMKSNSAVRGLRPGITHNADKNAPFVPRPAPGHIELVLYSLALKRLAPHFLMRGVLLTAVKVLELVQSGLEGSCSFNNAVSDKERIRQMLCEEAPESLVAFSASLAPDVREGEPGSGG